MGFSASGQRQYPEQRVRGRRHQRDAVLRHAVRVVSAGLDPGIPGDDQRLLRRVRTGVRRRAERHHQERRQHDSGVAATDSCATTTSTRRRTPAASSTASRSSCDVAAAVQPAAVRRLSRRAARPRTRCSSSSATRTSRTTRRPCWRHHRLLAQPRPGLGHPVEEHDARAAAEERLERQRPQPLLGAAQPDDEGRQNCSGQGGDGCNSSPLWTEEKRATFNGPIWSALGTWTSTLSGNAFNEMRAYYGVNKIRITSNLARHIRPRPAEQNAVDGTVHRAHLSRRIVWRVHDRRARRRDQLLPERLADAGHRQAPAQGRRTARAREVPDGHRRLAERPLGIPGRRRLQPSPIRTAIPTRSTPPSARPRTPRRSGTTRSTRRTRGRSRDNLTLNLGLRYDVDNTITVGNDLVDARNARYLANLGVAPLGKVKQGPQQRRAAPRLRLGAHRGPQARHPRAAPASSTIRTTSTTTTSTSTRRCSPIVASISTATARRTIRSTTPPRVCPRHACAAAHSSPSVSRSSRTSPASASFPSSRSPWPLISACRTRGRPPSGSRGSCPAASRSGRLRLFLRQRRAPAAERQSGLRERRSGSTRIRGSPASTSPKTSATSSTTPCRRARNIAAPSCGPASPTRSRRRRRTAAPAASAAAPRPTRWTLSVDDGPTNEDRRHNVVVGRLLPVPARLPAGRDLSLRQRAALQREQPLRDQRAARAAQLAPRRRREELRPARRQAVQAAAQRLGINVFWEMFNVFNTDNFQAYQGSLESTTFGQPGRALPKRRQQFGFRVDF